MDRRQNGEFQTIGAAPAGRPVTNATVLELRALSKQFPTHRALDGVHLSIRKGEFFSLVGPSGCGKTTTLRLIAGFERPTEGEILLNGQSIGHLPPYQRDVSTVFQNYALFPHLTVAQNISFGLERHGLAKPVREEKVKHALELVQLAGKETRLPHQISGGERQRVALARSLVLQPQILLLDEPLSALDPQLRKRMRAELKNLQRQVDTTFLFITHDQEEALSLSDRVAVMHAGKLEQIGEPEEVYRKPQSRFVAEFLGEMNWIEGVGVRPESLRVSHALPDSVARFLEGTVRDVTFLGSRVHVRTEVQSGAQYIAEMDAGDVALRNGDAVCLWWRSDDELGFAAGADARVPAPA